MGKLRDVLKTLICCATLLLLAVLIPFVLTVDRTVHNLNLRAGETLGRLNEQVDSIGRGIAGCRHDAIDDEDWSDKVKLLSEGCLTPSLLGDIRRTLEATQSTEYALQRPLNALTHSVYLINKDCEPGPCGTIADANKTLATARMTLGQIEIAAHHEDKNLAKLDRQEEQLFADVDKTLTSANESLTDMQLVTAHTDALLSSPELQSTLDNAASSSTTMDHMLATADAVETKATKGYLHPSKHPLARVWHALSPFLLPVAQISTAIR